MRLHPMACEYYRLQIVTTPEVASNDWQISIDNGITWVGAQIVDSLPAWLVAGPEYTGGETALVITHNVSPLLRLVDSPETIIDIAPEIELVKC